MTEILRRSPQNFTEGESGMTGFETWTKVHARFRRGQSKRKLARELGLDRKTVKRILAQERPVSYARQVVQPTKVAPYLEYRQPWAPEVDDHAYRLFLELPRQGYRGGDERVKRAVRPLRAERDRLTAATRRCETAPGRQAQVDWGSAWAQMGEDRVRLPVFVMVLGYSRRL